MKKKKGKINAPDSNVKVFETKAIKNILQHLQAEWWKYGLETMVVVIGILIAFMLNNWNENRKSGIKSREYRERLISDIISDTINIHNALEIRKTTISNIRAYFEFFDSSNVSLEVHVDSSRHVDHELARYFPVNYTFKDMQSSGNLSLLTPDQQHIMSELSAAQEFAQMAAEKLMDGFWHEVDEEIKYMGKWRPGENDFYKTIGVKQDPQALAQGLLHRQNKFSSLVTYHTVAINTGNAIIQKSKEAIAILKDEL